MKNIGFKLRPFTNACQPACHRAPIGSGFPRLKIPFSIWQPPGQPLFCTPKISALPCFRGNEPWCNGSTTDFGSVCLGSDPNGSTSSSFLALSATAAFNGANFSTISRCSPILEFCNAPEPVSNMFNDLISGTQMKPYPPNTTPHEKKFYLLLILAGRPSRVNPQVTCAGETVRFRETFGSGGNAALHFPRRTNYNYNDPQRPTRTTSCTRIARAGLNGLVPAIIPETTTVV